MYADAFKSPGSAAPRARRARLWLLLVSVLFAFLGAVTELGAAPASGDAGEPLVFDCGEFIDTTRTVSGARWDFGDGTATSGCVVTHTFPMAGTYTVTLTIVYADGTTWLHALTVAIGASPPVANAGGPYAGTVGAALSLDGGGSSDTDGVIVAYAWDLGDGSRGTGATLTHVYSLAGVYSVSLLVTDNDGLIATDTTTATIGEPTRELVVTTAMDTNDGICDTECSLRDAIITANRNPGWDTIVFQTSLPLVLTLPGIDEDAALTGDLDISDHVVIAGAPGAPPVVIDAAGLDRVFEVFPGVALELHNAIVRGGSTLDYPYPASGAGIHNQGGAVSIEDAVLEANIASGYGGAIESRSADASLPASLLIARTEIRGNCAASGAGIDNDGALTISESRITANGETAGCAVSEGGAGLYLQGGTVTISASDITGNIASAGGGGIVSYNAVTTIERSTVAYNTGGTGGPSFPGAGGIENSGILTLRDSTVAFNKGADGGGLLNYAGGRAAVTNTTLVGNAAAGQGGGVYAANTLVTDYATGVRSATRLDLGNSIVALNQAALGADCATDNTDPDNSASAILLTGNSLVGDLTGCAIDTGGSATNAPPLLLSGDPQLGAFTTATTTGRTTGTGHFPPLPDSRTIDAGSAALCGTLDQLDHPRPTDGNGDGVAICDIGAVELAGSTGPVAPVAVILGPSQGLVGESLTFDGSASFDTDGQIVAYAWALGDGGVASGARITHSYRLPGSYVVLLSVTDNDGLSGARSQSVQIEQPWSAPVADAGGPYTGTVDRRISLDGSGSSDADGLIVAHGWDLGDGTSASGELTEHFYTAAGLYTVTLTVIDNDGLTGTDSTTADISPPALSAPVADAGGSYEGVRREPVTFDGSGSRDADGTIVGYAWDFGDGTQGMGAVVTHSYRRADVYVVTLTVTDNDGLSGRDAATATIRSSAKPPKTR